MKKCSSLLILLLLISSLAQVAGQGSHTFLFPVVMRERDNGNSLVTYGLNFISAAGSPAEESRYQKALSTSATWNRWPLYWYDVETSQGTFNWSDGDTVVIDDLAHGLETEIILMGTPSFYASGGQADVPPPQVGHRPEALWAASGETEYPTSPASTTPIGLYAPIFSDETDIPGPGKTINPNNVWARFVFFAVEHYGPLGITHWEIWNEEDYSFFWNGSVGDYARLLKVAYLSAKQADPAAQIILGGLANFEQPYFLRDLLNIYADDPMAPSHNWFFDILATHGYSRSWDSWLVVYRAKSRLGYHNLEKEIWLNESGSPAWNDYPGPTWDPQSGYRSTMAEGAAYVIQSAMYARYAGASAIFHFQLYDDCGNDPQGTDFPPADPPDDSSHCSVYDPCAGDAFGLFRNPNDGACYKQHPNPDTPRPVFDAYQVLSDHLVEMEPLWRMRPGGSDPYTGTQEWIAFYRPSRQERVIGIWSLVGITETATITATGSTALLVDQYGHVSSHSPVNGFYTIQLGPATNQNTPPPPGSDYSIGGPPLILIERDNQPPQTWIDVPTPFSSSVITVTWSGEDLGSGIAHYDVWLYQDGITRTLWLGNTTDQSAVYLGQAGKDYGFAITSRDRAGNEGTPPAEPQVMTTVRASGDATSDHP